jgi:hypothetical protein
MDDWDLVSDDPDPTVTNHPSSEDSRKTRKRHGERRTAGPVPAADKVALGQMVSMLHQFMEKYEEHYMMISGQLDVLHLALEAHKIGPWADPEDYIVHRLVKPDRMLADDLDPQTQLKLLAWLYRLHDPRIHRALAMERAMKTLSQE